MNDYNEPCMFIHRPSSARSQDTSHILSRIFRDLYQRDPVTNDTVNFLVQSKEGDDEVHTQYVAELKKVTEERDKKFSEISMLERHIQQAQAASILADERQLENRQNMPDLGLPPERSHFRRYLDSDLLRKYSLIVPEDYNPIELPIVHPPSAGEPNYTRETVNYSRRSNRHSSQISDRKILQKDDFVDDFGHLPSDDDSVPDTSAPPQSSKKKRNLNQSQEMEKLLWKKQMSADARQDARAQLANMQARVNFLRNPRYVSEVSENLLSKGNQVFLPIPEVVIISDYVPGKVYEVDLELKNITKVLRNVRVIPPRTTYFSIGLGRFPAENGLIASGMSCQFTVRFAPDSLADFEDDLVVQSNGCEFIVPLKGKRQPPILNIPEVIDLGGSLVGGTKVGQIQVQNTGGNGRFAVVPGSSWPTTQFKVKSQGGAVAVPPFEFRPSLFAVRPGQSTVLEISFSPKEVKEYETYVTIVCDNCHVKHIKLIGEGQLATVEISEVEGGEKIPAAGDLADTLCDHFIDFGILHPYTYMEKSFIVTNRTAVDLPFVWVIIKPDFREKPNEIRVRDVDTRFSITPDTGLLLANESMKFLLAFAPPTPKLYHSVLHFVLPQMPVPKTPAVDQSRPSSLTSLNRGSSVQTDLEDVAALQIDIRGTCDPFSVIFEPYALHIPGTIPVQTVVKRPIHVLNQSLSPIVFSFQRVTEPAIIHAEPAEGEIPPNSDCLVEICVSGPIPGKMEHNLMCLIQHHDEPVYLNVQAEFSGPEIVIDEASIPFGLVREGSLEERWITIRNQSRIPANWSITLEEGELGENELCIEPANGILPPLKCTMVKVELSALAVKSLNLLLSAKAEDGNTTVLRCTAEVQAPKVCLTECKIKLDDVFIESESRHAVVLYNQTVIPTFFKWGKVIGNGHSKVSVSMKPNKGKITERETLACILTIVCHSLEDVDDLRIPCAIEGQADPLWLSFSCTVKGLSVSFRDEESLYGSENVRISMDDFKIGSKVTKSLFMRNDTSIVAPFSCSLKNFGFKPPTPPHRAAMPNKGQRRALIQRSSATADQPQLTLRARTEAQRAILKNSNGLALILEPSAGVLEPYSEVEISVTACANLWGDYEDFIQCKVGDLPIQEIPVDVKVTGSPLLLQLSAMTTDGKTPVLRFGSQVAGSYVVRRQLKLLNNGPCDIRVDFQTFDRHEEDKQLVDFVVAYKPAFPVKDQKGVEVVPPNDEKEIEEITRQKTNELPPPSTDTSFVLSRATTLKVFREPRPQVLDVHVFEHDGQEPSKYFSVEPSQIIIPADGTNIAVVNYIPPPSREVKAPMDIIGHAVGWLSLPEKEKSDTAVSRKDGYHVDTLAVEMTAGVVPARLLVEFEDEDELHFRSAASDLLCKNKLLENYMHIRSVTLQNTSQTPIKLQFRTKPPFYIIGENDEAKCQTERVIVKSRQHLVVKIGFRLSTQLLDLLHSSEYDKSIPSNLETATSTSPKKTEDDDKTENEEEEFITHIDEGISFFRKGDDRRLQFSSDIILKYDNGESEILPTDAFILLPSIKASKNILEIGTCLVGEYRQRMFFLQNPSLSSSFWTISIGK
ncbi:DgyrCDS190 [Dimorphilus gyrociliatus]|uniref:DgyrCDS190 n=1 Tax=Dimorphilus gyrociliatus TaxID=2664684 RepID=A0A7I8V5K2_9ANNE|nr:DgyrCDS190 [Dimorphilus gyrociliatus]